MEKPGIIKANTREFYIRERLYIRELINDRGIGGFSLAEARVNPGVLTELHKLSIDEWYVIQSGSGLIEVGDCAPAAVGPGDIIPIAAGLPQRIRNDGDQDLVFHCICMPRFTPDAYTALEND